MLELEFRPRKSYMYHEGYVYCSLCDIAFKRKSLGRLICPFCGRPLRRHSRYVKKVREKRADGKRVDPEKYGVVV